MNIKIIMLAIAGIAFMQPVANAQSSKYAKNYPVCKRNGKYVICSKKEAMHNRQELSSGRSAEAKDIREAEEGPEIIYTNVGMEGKTKVDVAYEVPADAYAKDQPACDDEIIMTGEEAGYDAASPYYNTTLVCIRPESKSDNSRLKVTYDEPTEIYRLNEDAGGYEKNLERNMNYLDFRNRVPNDGGLATR